MFVFSLSHFSYFKEERYCQAVKRLEFDRQLGPYNLSQYGDWKHLSNYITKSIIERLGKFHLTTLGALNTAIYYEFLYNCRLCLIYYLFSICIYVSFSINFSFFFFSFSLFMLCDILMLLAHWFSVLVMFLMKNRLNGFETRLEIGKW